MLDAARSTSQARRDLQRILRAPRATWCLLLASTLSFFSLAWSVQELFNVQKSEESEPSGHPWIQMREPGVCLPWSLWIECGFFVALACWLPHRKHAQLLRRVELPMSDQVIERPSAWTYRAAPGRCIVVGVRAVDRLMGAYHVRLGVTLLLL